MTEQLLFADLKVIDMSSWIAGCATILADFGAQVIKVEPPEADGYRNFAQMPSCQPATSTTPGDGQPQQALYRMNLKTVRRWYYTSWWRKVTCTLPIPLRNAESPGLTYEDLAAINPNLIYASLTAYGEEGPEKDREGFDLVAYWGRSGLMDLVRPWRRSTPALPGMGTTHDSDLYASILTALIARQQTGKGSHVHTSLLANGMWSASCIAQGVFAEADFTLYLLPRNCLPGSCTKPLMGAGCSSAWSAPIKRWTCCLRLSGSRSFCWIPGSPMQNSAFLTAMCWLKPCARR